MADEKKDETFEGGVVTTHTPPVTEPPGDAPTVEAPVDKDGNVIEPPAPVPAGAVTPEVDADHTETVEVIPENEKPFGGVGEASADLRTSQSDSTPGSVVDDAKGAVETPVAKDHGTDGGNPPEAK